MKRRFKLVIMLAVAFFALACGTVQAHAASTDSIEKVLPTGTYTLDVGYYSDEDATQSSTAMNSFWDTSAQLVVNSSNQAKLVFTQKSMMSVMTSATFNGHSLVEKSEGSTGTWSVNLSPQEAIKLINGDTYLSNITYNSGTYKGNHDFYVKINSGVPDTIDQPGEYALAVEYNKYEETALDGDSGEASMIQENSIWSDNITYQLKGDGTAELTLTQQSMMDYMTNLSFDGVQMDKHVNTSDATSGTWTATIPAATVKKISNGNKIVANMTYTVASINFTHTVDAVVVINSKSLVKADSLVTVAEAEAATNTDSTDSSSTDSSSTDSSSTDSSSTDSSSTDSSSTGSSSTGSSSTGSSSASSSSEVETSVANVEYHQADAEGKDLNELSMIQTDGIWSDAIKIQKNSNGTATVTITQNKMMNYMTKVTFNGVEMTKNVTSANATSGTWTGVLSKEKAADLKVGNKILIGVSYTIPNLFTHNVQALAVIKSITEGTDEATTSDSAKTTTTTKDIEDVTAPTLAVAADVSSSSASADSPAKQSSKSTLPQTGEANYSYASILGVLALITAIGLGGTLLSVGRFRK
ncbi:MAG: LPXTG cell wall anchor domain-containing protein [Liquorilactobacillus sp.]|uniref:LPXTG cell wall anchor domain-containing protein n=1 Tax=Liquorilactobacillus sp. TaxID=2767923 RepID=UPI0039E9DBA0